MCELTHGLISEGRDYYATTGDMTPELSEVNAETSRLFNLYMNNICRCRFCFSLNQDMFYSLRPDVRWVCVSCWEKIKD